MELHAGHHTVVQLLGLNVNLDTLIMTWIVAAIVIVVTLLATRGRSMVPSGLQNGMEMIVEALLDQFKENLGPKYGQVTSVLLTMFLFIFFANEFGLLPNPGEYNCRFGVGRIVFDACALHPQSRRGQLFQTFLSAFRPVLTH